MLGSMTSHLVNSESAERNRLMTCSRRLPASKPLCVKFCLVESVTLTACSVHPNPCPVNATAARNLPLASYTPLRENPHCHFEFHAAAVLRDFARWACSGASSARRGTATADRRVQSRHPPHPLRHLLQMPRPGQGQAQSRSPSRS